MKYALQFALIISLITSCVSLFLLTNQMKRVIYYEQKYSYYDSVISATNELLKQSIKLREDANVNLEKFMEITERQSKIIEYYETYCK